MDLEGWEILPEDGYLEIQYDGGNKIFSRKYGADGPNNLYKNNYFPSQEPSEFMESTEKSRSKVPINKSSSTSLEKIKVVPDSEIPLEADHDPVSQVFFKKMIENKSVDIKMDSPKSNNTGLIPQMDPGTLQHENKANPMKDETMEGKNSSPKSEIDKITEIRKEISDEVNIWKWSLNGFGAICSFGVVAASICIILLGGRKQDKQLHQQNQKVQFHIFAQDKRIEQVVHHATRLNEAISAMRGVPGVRAQITYGGCYEGL